MKNKAVQQKNGKVLEKNIVWFLVLEVVVIAAVAWILVLQKQWYSIAEYKQQEQQDLNIQLNQRQEQLNELVALQQAYTAVNDERVHYAERVLPIGLNPPEMISRLEYLGQQANVKISSIDIVNGDSATPTTTKSKTPADQATPDTTQTFSQDSVRTGNITMNVTLNNAGYTELKNFLDALESFTPVLDLQTVQYTIDTQTFALQLRTYYIDPQAYEEQ